MVSFNGLKYVTWFMSCIAVWKLSGGYEWQKSDKLLWRVSSVQSLSCVRLLVTPWTTAHQASLSITNPQSLLKLMSIELVMPSSHLTLCRPLLYLPSIFPSIRVFSNESALHIRWPKYWPKHFSFDISPSNEHPGLISFRKDWLDLLAVQGTLKSLLQHHISEASILLLSAFFIVQFFKNFPQFIVIHTVNQHLFSIYFVPGSVLGIWGIKMTCLWFSSWKSL